MKYIITADLHLSNYPNDKLVDGMPERLNSTLKTLEEMTTYAEENDITRFIIAGDIYDTKNLIHSIAQNAFINFIKSHPDIRFIMIDGNHDVANRTGHGESALVAIGSLPNVMVLHKSGVIDGVLFVPWYSNMVNDIKEETNCNFLVAHLGVNEAQMSSGISVVSDIKLSDLSKFKMCWLGHYHKPQHLKNVYYVGSPIQLNAGEGGEEKRFLVVDTTSCFVESILTTQYKRYHKLEINRANKDEVLQQAREMRKDGQHVSLLVTENLNDDSINDFQIIDKRDPDISNRGISKSMTDEEIVNKYMDIKEVEDKDYYKKVALDIIGTSN